MKKINTSIIPLLIIMFFVFNNFIFANEIDKNIFLGESKYSAGVGLDVGTNTVYIKREIKLMQSMGFSTYIGFGFWGFNLGFGLHPPKFLTKKLKLSLYKNFDLLPELVNQYTLSGSYVIKKFNTSPIFISIGVQHVKYSRDDGYICNYEKDKNGSTCPEIKYFNFTYPVFSMEYKF